MLAGNNVFDFWPFVIFLTGASPSFASIINQTPWRSEKPSARSLRIVFTIERKNTGRHELLRDFIVLKTVELEAKLLSKLEQWLPLPQATNNIPNYYIDVKEKS